MGKREVRMSVAELALVAIAIQLLLLTLFLWEPSLGNFLIWAIGTLANMVCFLLTLKKWRRI
jgi:hypothetical protein